MNKYFLSLSLLTVPFGASAMDSGSSSSNSSSQTSSQSVAGAEAQLSPAFIKARFSNPDELLPYLKNLTENVFISYAIGYHYWATIKSDYVSYAYDKPWLQARVDATRLGDTYSAHLFVEEWTSTFSDPKKCFEIIQALFGEQQKYKAKNQRASSSK